jgi:hypothetical protein
MPEAGLSTFHFPNHHSHLSSPGVVELFPKYHRLLASQGEA